jgi:Holliday junction DNA helicase RuvA
VIASLAGTIASLEANAAVIDVAGVGYLVQLTSATSANLKVGESTLLFTSFIVREDGFSLYGFTSASEQKAFDLLRSVTGVGPKSALAVLGELSVDQIKEAVDSENDAAFRSVTGVGPKTAKLIVLTLTGKLGIPSRNASEASTPELANVISALIGLGWNERSAIEAVTRARKILGSESNANTLLKEALNSLGSSKTIGASNE